MISQEPLDGHCVIKVDGLGRTSRVGCSSALMASILVITKSSSTVVPGSNTTDCRGPKQGTEGSDDEPSAKASFWFLAKMDSLGGGGGLQWVGETTKLGTSTSCVCSRGLQDATHNRNMETEGDIFCVMMSSPLPHAI